MQISRSKSLVLASRFTFPAMQFSRLKSLAFALAFVFCLLPNFGLRAQTAPDDITISGTANTTAQSLAADQNLIVEDAATLVVASGVAVTGLGGNTITNGGTISATDGVAISITGASDNTITNSGTINATDGVAISTTAHGLTVTNNEGDTIAGAAGGIHAQTGVTIMNAGTIDATSGAGGQETAIRLEGTVSDTALAAAPDRPAIGNTAAIDLTDTAVTDALDAYYFNGKITNTATGVIEAEDLANAFQIGSPRVQIINHGTISELKRQLLRAQDSTSPAILFLPASGESFVYNTGTITSGGSIIRANEDIGTGGTGDNASGIVIYNTGTMTSARDNAIVLQNGNLIVNSGSITSAISNAIRINGFADATLRSTNTNRPAYDAESGTFSDSERDTYYFSSIIINELGGTIASTNGDENSGIYMASKRAQIINYGDITTLGTGIVSTINAVSAGVSFFHTISLSTSGESFLYNAGNITSTSSSGTVYARSNVRGITIHNDVGGRIENTGGIAIQLVTHNIIVNAGEITGASDGIRLSGQRAGLSGTVPAWDADKATRDAYYAANTIINEATGVITGKGSNHGIRVGSKRTQIINYGTIKAEGSGHGIAFEASSGESIVVNAGTISSATGWGILAHANASGIVVVNGGTISGGGGAIRLSNGDDILVIRAGSNIVGAVDFAGGADELIYASADADGVLTNTITGLPASGGTRTITSDSSLGGPFLINISSSTTAAKNLRFGHHLTVQAAGSIEVAAGTAVTGAGDNEINNAGTISSGDSDAIVLQSLNLIVNTGTITSTTSTAIVLQSLNVIMNTGTITGGTDSHGIDVAGPADADMLAAQVTAPAFDATEALRDAYYFNNKVINDTGGTITGTGTDGHGINIAGLRAQIINFGGRIVAAGTGHGIYFTTEPTDSGQGFVQSTGSITANSGNAIHADPGINEIVIHNTGTLESTSAAAILLRSLNLIVNAGEITGGTNSHGIDAAGGANPATIREGPADVPAYDAEKATRDAYYFNNIVINETGGTITGKGAGHGIHVASTRAQILNNGGDIGDSQSGNGNGINFAAGSGQSFVYNTGSISGFVGSAIVAADGANGIVIHNGGTIESAGFHAIDLQSLNLIVNSGDISTGANGHSILLSGTADADMVTANPTAPAWDASETDRDAYYFNNIIINEVGGTITTEDNSRHGIAVIGKRVQIFNHGIIEATGAGHGIYFDNTSGESIVVNTGTIRSTSGWGIAARHNTNGSIVIINGGTITGGAGAIRLSEADDILVIRSGSNITGSVDFRDGDADELIYAGAQASGRLAASTLSGLETTSESSSTSDLGAVAPDPTPTPDSTTDPIPEPTTPDPVTPDPSDPNGGSGGGPTPAPNGGSGGGPSSSSASLGNYQTLFALSDELILDLNAGIQDAIYEHKFSLNSEKDASEDTPWWTQGFGSFRAQDESDNNAKASHTLGGVLVGYDLTPEQIGNLGLKDLGLPLEIKNLGFFLGVALGSLSTDDDAELITQNFFGGINFELTKDEFFYGFNFAIGITYYNSERSVKESGETANIRGRYTGFFLSPEFIIGMKTQVKVPSTAPKTDELSFWERMKAQVNGMEIIPSLRVRYSLALLGEYTEDSDAADRISAEKRNTGSVESRAQVAFPFQLANQAWKLEPRLGLAHRFDLNKSDFDVETTQTETAINYDAEKESTLGIFGGLSVAYLRENTAFKFNVDTILSGESLVLRAQAGFGFAF